MCCTDFDQPRCGSDARSPSMQVSLESEKGSVAVGLGILDVIAHIPSHPMSLPYLACYLLCFTAKDLDLLSSRDSHCVDHLACFVEIVISLRTRSGIQTIR